MSRSCFVTAAARLSARSGTNTSRARAQCSSQARVLVMVSTRAKRAESGDADEGDLSVAPSKGRAVRRAKKTAADKKPPAGVRKPSTADKKSSTVEKKSSVADKKSSTTDKKSTSKKAKSSSAVDVPEREPRDLSYFLFKSEPESRLEKGIDMRFSIDDLANCKNQTEPWDGVRNHEAKNTMLAMRVGDLGFFYHSNCKRVRPGVVGIVQVVREAYPDHTAWDPADPHYDPKSKKENPRWWMVDVRLIRKFGRCVTLDEIKESPELSEMQLVKRGRISVQHVRREEWDMIVSMADNGM